MEFEGGIPFFITIRDTPGNCVASVPLSSPPKYCCLQYLLSPSVRLTTRLLHSILLTSSVSLFLLLLLPLVLLPLVLLFFFFFFFSLA